MNEMVHQNGFHGSKGKAAEQLADAVTLTRETYDRVRGSLPFFVRGIFRLLLRLQKGTLIVQLPDHRRFRIETGAEGPLGEIILHNWRLARKVALGGTIGVAESYMDHDWDSPDVTAVLALFVVNRSIYNDVAAQSPVINWIETARHALNANTRSRSKRNIAAHYDLGNAFYEKWLDPSMTYSSAIYEDGANSLEAAQAAKYRSLADQLGIKRDSHVLEIGCGWGGFAQFAAGELGANVTGLTISKEQLSYAQNRIKKAGLDDKVELKFQDYRDETGRYDHIVSIEMFEAVGERYWPTYFGKVHDCLKPGGTAGLQIITINNEAFEAYRRRPDFIQRYIFPGGMLPSSSVLEKTTSEQKLKLVRERIFPDDYARTLAEWRERFWEAWEDIKPLGFDERFKRMWEFYLHYCEAGFLSRGIDVRQMFYQRA